MQTIKLVWSLILVLAVADTAHAQGIGGLIRKKVEQATKPKDEQAPKEAGQDRSLFSFEPTAEALASYKRGLELEVRLRNEYRDRLARLKTSEQYQACEQGAATSPDALKLAEESSARMDKATAPEELQKVYVWQNERFKAIALKQCGEDPRPLIQQRAEVLRKAEEAGVREAAKGWKRRPAREDHDGAREESDFTPDQTPLEDPAEPADIAPVATRSIPARWHVAERRQQSSEIDLQDYRLMKELVTKYCSLSPAMRTDAEANGIRVPGTGNNIYWVFPQWFAVWVGPDCAHLMKLYTFLDESAAPPPAQ